jgi:hypothetical protein
MKKIIYTYISITHFNTFMSTLFTSTYATSTLNTQCHINTQSAQPRPNSHIYTKASEF